MTTTNASQTFYYVQYSRSVPTADGSLTLWRKVSSGRNETLTTEQIVKILSIRDKYFVAVLQVREIV